jgi:cytochrome c oxidase cbb3-type subunit III
MASRVNRPTCRVAVLAAVLMNLGRAAEPTSAAAQVAQGRAEFTKACSFCHGPDATGGAEGPNLTLSSVVRHDAHGELIGAVIREGRPNRGMPPIALQPEQIAAVVSFLHAQVAELDRRSAGKPPSSYALEHLLTGNADRGKAFFHGAGRCATCHSESKDLAGIARKYPPVELQTRFLYPPEVPTAVEVETRTGEHVTGTLVFEDAFIVSLQDGDGWYHSWPLNSVSVKRTDRLAAHRELLGRYTQGNMHDVFAYLETLK